ncbi:helix-turn-helix transcriptional regulator [Nocardia salmonicida]|uniref:helix-turn-helix domain-containing protein n=1 Tax=Nocardia salmonicida TaxID=53431 RepID=UPI00340FE72A
MTGDWFTSTPESEAMLAEERLILDATELVHEALAVTGVSRKELARRIGVRPSEVSQRLSGRRNLTLHSIAAMLHALGYQARLTMSPSVPSVYMPQTWGTFDIARGIAGAFNRNLDSIMGPGIVVYQRNVHEVAVSAQFSSEGLVRSQTVGSSR